MTIKEKRALTAIAERIKELAGMENCSLSEKSKEEFRPYMMWFDICAMNINEIVEISDDKNRYYKDERLSEIIRTN